MESWIIDQLIQQGVRHFCLAPGSRSTPLVSAALLHKRAELHVHYDERGLGFYALGIGKATGKPAALIITSGTAVGNLLPSVMEAHHTCTPLILLTADRPLALRDCGANQTTDQVKIFQPFIRWQTDLAAPTSEKHLRSLAAQAYFQACQNPPGPIQCNISFGDPLYNPALTATPGKPLDLHFPRHTTPAYKTEKTRGLLLAGKLPHPNDIHPILDLARRLQWPLCADILSNARAHPSPEQIRYFDFLDKPKPDLILHFGERMTSKRIGEWMEKIHAETLHISPYPFLQDPHRLLSGRIQSDIPEFCQTFTAPHDPTWLSQWIDREPQFQETGPFTEVHAMRQISELLPPHFGVFLGNGMPIRDADHFLFPKQSARFFSNRGLSGIDGNIATLAGLARAMPILGILGDQAALHDLNSLPLLKKTRHPVILLISNNFGGGIFHHLPISQSPHFEPFWAAAHSLRFEPAAQMFGLPFFPFEKLNQALAAQQSSLVELITDRKANHEYQLTIKPIREKMACLKNK